jgi:hypothetical protein
MLINRTELESLPDYLSLAEVERLSLQVLAQSSQSNSNGTFTLLSILADHQWHNYALPSHELSVAIEGWLKHNLNEDSAENCLKISYCFALSRNFYELALGMYHGESDEYFNDLQHSLGDRIDPYWSMPKVGA